MSVVFEGADVTLLVNVGSDTSPVWKEVAGQRDMTVETVAALADVSTKLDTHEKPVPVRHGGTIELAGLVIPDDLAYQVLKECTCTRESVMLRIAQNGVDAWQATGVVARLRRRADDDAPWLVDVTLRLSEDLQAL